MPPLLMCSLPPLRTVVDVVVPPEISSIPLLRMSVLIATPPDRTVRVEPDDTMRPVLVWPLEMVRSASLPPLLTMPPADTTRPGALPPCRITMVPPLSTSEPPRPAARGTLRPDPEAAAADHRRRRLAAREHGFGAAALDRCAAGDAA